MRETALENILSSAGGCCAGRGRVDRFEPVQTAAGACHVRSSIATTPITNLTANLFTAENHLGPAGNDVFIEFRDAGGKLVDVGDVSFELGLSGSAAIVHSVFRALRTSAPGQYRVNVRPQIAGEWQAKLSITGPVMRAEVSFPVMVK